MADVNIKYKGASIATLDATGDKTLLTSGKYCEANIEVEYTKPAGGVIQPLTVTANGTYTASGDVDGYSPIYVSVPSESVTLYAPTISRSGATLTINKNSNNGNFQSGFNIYIDNTLVGSVAATGNATYTIPYETLTAASHTITATTYGAKANESAKQTALNFVVYQIVDALSNCVKTTGINKVIQGNTEAIVYTANTGYMMPESISISGAAYTVSTDRSTITVTPNGSQNVAVNITAVPRQMYSIMVTEVTNCYEAAGNPTQIGQYQTVELNFVVFDGYTIKDGGVVGTGATFRGKYTKVIVSNPTGDVELSVTAEIGTALPEKGQLINIDMDGDGTTEVYRVIRNNDDDTTLCLKMDEVNPSIAVNSSSRTTTFTYGSKTQTGQNYEGGTLDTYLNTTWYNTLSAQAKAAIVPQQLTLDMWLYGSSGYDADKLYNGNYISPTSSVTSAYTIGHTPYEKAVSDTRNVYALSMNEVIEYITTTGDGKLESYNIWKMFYNTATKPSINYIHWFRSAVAGGTSYVWCEVGNSGRIYEANYASKYPSRPAFTIDLSKIDWS